MNEIKLKPCPFCGGAAGFRERQLFSDGMTQMKAVCMLCEAESPSGAISMNGFRSDKGYFGACENAAWRWNERAGVDMKNIKESFIHARNLEQILLDNLFSGEAFEKTENGFSNFFMIACLACNGADICRLAELYSLAITDGDDCIQEVALLANLEILKGEKLTLEVEFQKMLALSTGAFNE